MANIKIMALGGLGEDGKNLYIVEVNSKIFILDAGIKYPAIDMYGVESVIPNMDYLIERKDQIEGIFISHGHEDNCGALPYLLHTLHTRVYGSHFTISIVEAILSEYDMDINDFKLFRINANKVMKFGDVSVTFFNTSHSIPESMGIIIQTTDGIICYATDFNFSATGESQYKTSFDKINELSDQKVIALLSESVNAQSIDRIKNDSLLEHNFNNILINNHNRVIVAAFSTDLIRIQKIIDLSVSNNRKVAIIGKKTERIISVAIQSGYLTIPEDKFFHVSSLTKEELESLKDSVIIVTGLINGPYLSLTKMALGEHEYINLLPTDDVVLMCPPKSGTEKFTANAINILYQYDANLTIFDKSILRSNHACSDDLKLLYAMIKPEYIIPIKGEYRQMYSQFLIAKEYGYDKEHILLLDNGEQLSFNNGILDKDINTFTATDVYIDRTAVGVVDDNVLEERSILSEDGIIILNVAVNSNKKILLNKITFNTKGFSLLSEEELSSTAEPLLKSIINNQLTKSKFNIDQAKEKLSTELSNMIYHYTRRHPIVEVVIFDLKK